MPELNPKAAITGLNLSNVTSQIRQGQLTWAVNAVVQSFSGDKITYSNEQANVLSTIIPAGYRVIGNRYILEEGFTFLWLANSKTGDSEIGKETNGVYSKIINARCLNLSVDNPILKHAHRNTNCGLEIYWVDSRNRGRFLNMADLPYKEVDDVNSCGNIITDEIDCNKLNLQPNFSIPAIDVKQADAGGSITSGSYQFAVQYANSLGEPYSSFYSVTNPGAVFQDQQQASQDFDFIVNKALEVTISNIDDSGVYDFINLAVIKTINNITSVDLVGTYRIEKPTKTVIYTGQASQQLDINDIFQRYPTYDAPGDLTVAQDILILADLKGEERIAYQGIANKIRPLWQTNRLIGKDAYKKVENTIAQRGYMRDEVYPLSLVFELDNGHITDNFPLIGRDITDFDKELINNQDVIANSEDECSVVDNALPRWKVYNTGSTIGSLHPDSVDDCYEGPWEYGEFAYWESTDTYDCNEAIWGEMTGKPIRHFKFPDCNITHIHDNQGYIYPIGVRIDVAQVVDAIKSSSLTDIQKSRITGFRIVRGNRATKESVIAKGLINNVLKYDTEGNIIDAATGAQSGSGTGNSAETNTRTMLNQAYDYTRKAHKEYNSYAFLSVIGTITVGANIKQNNRYHDAEDLIKAVQNSQDLFSTENVTRLEQASAKLQEIIDNSGGDARGKAHSQAAKALVDGLIQIMTAQIEIDTLMAETAINTPAQTDFNRYAYFPNYLFNDVRQKPDGTPADFFLDNTIIDEDAKKRYTLHSPDTSFTQPELGNILKLETSEYGISSGHLSEVKKHARYQFVSTTGYITALLAGVSIGFASGSYGVGSVNVFNGQASFTAYQAFLDILYKTIPRKNFAYQWNAVGEYTGYKDVENNGNKQRLLDIAAYMGAGMQNMSDDHTVNNFQRESSIYLRTTNPLPFTHEQGAPKDSSKLAVASYQVLETPISSYYASLKRNIVNQYGQIGDYEVIDTGWRKSINLDNPNYTTEVVMGGDVFINKFAYKSKFPFFIDNRVNFPDGADISYNELSNVGRVKYWFSTDVTSNSSIFDSFFATMTQKFFWPQISELYLNGKIFLFAYGIPYFFCESTVNVDARQAYNNKEGDFYPHVASGIPDEWLQEINVPIAQDNTYFYNKSFSKQNKETNYTFLPIDYDFNDCRTNFPFRSIFSEQSTDNPNPSLRNNWRIFKPGAYFDFPQNYGALISLDGVQNREVLARFENKTLLYNALLTAPTNTSDVYLGSSLFSRQVPPLDFADTDGGYIGTLNKFLLKTPYGQVTIDAVRGQIFLLQGHSVQNLSGDIAQFLEEFADFQINKSFPQINVDNHYKGIGWTGVFDNKNNRFIITKLDYKPLISGIEYIQGNFYYNQKKIQLSDVNYFCNYSYTLSYSFDIQGWVGFHTYIPNYYINVPDRFKTGIADSIWQHNLAIDKFNNFYNTIHPYILEYPYRFKNNDEILQNIKDYSRVFTYNDYREPVEVDDKYFNKLIITGPYQSSGILELSPKPQNNLSSYNKYPIYKSDSKEILYTKTNSFYQINTFWSLVLDKKKPIWVKDCKSLSNYKMLNQENMDYSKRSHRKEPIRGKDLRVRYILDDKDEVQIISEFTLSQTVQSYK